MAWMRSRLAAPPKGSKGKGKGKGSGKPKGASQGTPPKTQPPPALQEGPARRRPNLKPNEERATPTLTEIKCQKCQAYNWTSREVCRSCETLLARLPGISSSSTQPPQPLARPSGTLPGKTCADAAAGSAPASQSALTLDKDGLSQRQAELETLIGTLPDAFPLKTELSTQLDTVKEKLKDPRQPGARLDSATAPPSRLRVFVVRRCSRLVSFFQTLAEEREAAPGAEPPSKKGRVGPYKETTSMKAVKDAEVRTKLESGQAYLGFMLAESLKSGDGSCQAVNPATPARKGSGKGNGFAPGAEAGASQEPPPPPAPTQEKEKEATQPT